MPIPYLPPAPDPRSYRVVHPKELAQRPDLQRTDEADDLAAIDSIFTRSYRDWEAQQPRIDEASTEAEDIAAINALFAPKES